MEIIFGTSNIHKVEQLREYMEQNQVEIKLLTLKDINFDEEIEETGKTLEENSLIKARAIKEYCEKNNINKAILTDDTGLFVDYLDGAPGVYTGRYAGENSTQQENIEKLLYELRNASEKERSACMVTVLTLILPNGEQHVVRGEVQGKIAETPGKLGGLKYGPVFIMEGETEVMSNMPYIEISSTHRGRAFNKLIDVIKYNNI